MACHGPWYGVAEVKGSGNIFASIAQFVKIAAPGYFTLKRHKLLSLEGTDIDGKSFVYRRFPGQAFPKPHRVSQKLAINMDMNFHA